MWGLSTHKHTHTHTHSHTKTNTEILFSHDTIFAVVIATNPTVVWGRQGNYFLCQIRVITTEAENNYSNRHVTHTYTSKHKHTHKLTQGSEKVKEREGERDLEKEKGSERDRDRKRDSIYRGYKLIITMDNLHFGAM